MLLFRRARIKKASPFILVLGLFLYGAGLTGFSEGGLLILQPAGFALTCLAIVFAWQKRGENAFGVGQVALMVFTGAVLSVFSFGLATFMFWISQLVAMLGLGHILCAIVISFYLIVQKHPLIDNDKGYITWALPILMLIAWAIIAAIGSLFAESAIPLYARIANVCYPLRWWSLSGFPFTLGIRFIYNKLRWKKYRDG